MPRALATGVELRGYQREGVAWLLHNYEHVRGGPSEGRGWGWYTHRRPSSPSLAATGRARTRVQDINGVLADEMGLGKTLQTITFFLAVEETRPSNAPFLVVCPLSLVRNWQDELARFAPTLPALAFVGSQAERAAHREAIAAFVNGLPAAQQADPPFRFKVVVVT